MSATQELSEALLGERWNGDDANNWDALVAIAGAIRQDALRLVPAGDATVEDLANYGRVTLSRLGLWATSPQGTTPEEGSDG